MRRRRDPIIFVAPAVAAAVIAVGAVVTWLPGRGNQAPLAVEQPAIGQPVIEQPAGDDFDAQFRTGVHLLQVGRPQDAVALFEAARRLRPEVPEVHVNLGYAQLAAADHIAAEQSFRAAIDLRPGQVNAYYGWAEALELLGDLDGAVGAMRTYVHLAPEDDPFRRRAMAALWEWQVARGGPTAADPATAPDDATPPAGVVAVGDRLPALTIERLDGVVDTVPGDGRALVINVWATWCPPCRAEMPSLQRLSDRLGSDRYAVVGISIDEDADFVAEYLRDVGVDFARHIDSTQAITRQVLGAVALPQTLLVDADGTVVARMVGEREWDSPDMQALVEALYPAGSAVAGPGASRGTPP